MAKNVNGILHHTLTEWFNFIASSNLAGEINFWTLPKNISVVEGQVFFFKKKSEILGFAEVVRSELLTVKDAWSIYGVRNGAASLPEFNMMLRKSHIPFSDLNEETVLLCIILTSFLPVTPIPFEKVGLKHVWNYKYLKDSEINNIRHQVFASLHSPSLGSAGKNTPMLSLALA